MTEISGNITQDRIQQLQMEANTAKTKFEASQADQKVAFSDKEISAGEAFSCRSDVEVAETAVTETNNVLQSKTGELTSLTGDLRALSDKLNGLTDENEIASIKEEIENKKTEIETKKSEVEEAKKENTAATSSKNAADIALQRAETAVTTATTKLEAAEKALETSKEISIKADKDLKEAQEAAKKEEAKAVTGNKELDAKLAAAGYEPETGKAVAKSAENKAKEMTEAGSKNNCQEGVRKALQDAGILAKDDSCIVGDAKTAAKEYSKSAEEGGRFDKNFNVLKNLSSDEIKELEKVPGVVIYHVPNEGEKADDSASVDKKAYLEHGHVEIMLGDGRRASDKITYDNPNDIPTDDKGNKLYSVTVDHSKDDVVVLVPIKQDEVQEAGTGKYIDNKLKDAIERSNLSSDDKSRLVGMAEKHQELSKEDVSLLDKINKSDLEMMSMEFKAFGGLESSAYRDTTVKGNSSQAQQMIKNGQRSLQRQLDSNYIAKEHLQYLNSTGGPSAKVENFPKALRNLVASGGSRPSVSGLCGMEQGIPEKNGSNRLGRDNIITIKELKTQPCANQEMRKNYDAMIKFLEQNEKTSCDINKFRQMVIDASKTGATVNFMDCLS